MPKENDRAIVESTALARLDPQALIIAAVQNNAGIETMERLVALAKTVRDQDAKEAWHRAICRFQESLPAVMKTKSGQAGAGKFNYAPLSELMEKIQPVMGPLGLSISFRRRQDKEYVYSTCRISHEMGHYEESGEVAIPIEKPAADGKGASAAQKVGIADTYSKRYALLAILAIAPVEDPDADSSSERKPTVEPPRRASEVAKAAPAEHAPAARTESPARPPAQDAPAAAGRLISEAQNKRLWAIAYNAGKNLGLSNEDAADKVHAICSAYGFDSTNDVTMGKYDKVIAAIQDWGAGG
jgi:hypothetical protein